MALARVVVTPRSLAKVRCGGKAIPLNKCSAEAPASRARHFARTARLQASENGGDLPDKAAPKRQVALTALSVVGEHAAASCRRRASKNATRRTVAANRSWVPAVELAIVGIFPSSQLRRLSIVLRERVNS